MLFKVYLFMLTLLAADLVTARVCLGNAIQCYYPTGRCARTCVAIDCVCPDARPGLGGQLTRSKCIDIVKALGRHQC
ncbi:uncharacterized protein LY79DRAFT_572657 [Colletotrichum navitas]|uniref:Extracellular membrane protein CFEM domain-containing protein n=1 Tax=Colletotrichum navitas TaxID=681940 RepID=A0AAD8UX98_9PEZI|nr:uncharacterized protein LY79DRAFT_572657 [Colletotrichum navitas]KAK1566118.1 hypothetical protein LY79DRAFT_572657 [Colletotrichum navitas]